MIGLAVIGAALALVVAWFAGRRAAHRRPPTVALRVARVGGAPLAGPVTTDVDGAVYAHPPALDVTTLQAAHQFLYHLQRSLVALHSDPDLSRAQAYAASAMAAGNREELWP